MKKLVLSLALTAATVAAFAQGKVGFVNDSTRVFTLGAVLAQDAEFSGQAVTAALPSGPLAALLYAGTTAGSLSLQTSVTLEGTSLPQAGRMATKNVVLNGIVGGSPVNFQIVLIQAGVEAPETIVGGADRDAFSGSQYFGTSGLFTFTPGTSVTYPVIYAGTSTWAAGPLMVHAVPEPSSLALAGFGVASLLIFRRRK